VGLTEVASDDPFEDLDFRTDPLANLDRATQQLTVSTEERRYGKQMVVIDGFDEPEGLEWFASVLKSALGTGGTVKEANIEIQGDYEERIPGLLTDRGYQVPE
jgi:translation initiation factor 1